MYKKKQFVLTVLVIMVVASLFLTGCDNQAPQTSLSSTYSVAGVVENDSGNGIEDVTLNFSGFGTASTESDGTWQKTGLSGSVTITPAKDGYSFEPDSVDVSEAASGIQITATADTHSVNVSTEGEGTVNQNTLSPASGSEVELTAEPADGWKFDHWKGDISGTENPKTVTVEEDMNITAVFVEKDYPLNVTIEGEGTVNEKELSTSGSKEIEVTAQPNTGWKFDKWEGDLSGSENPTTIIVDKEKNITAVFVKKSYSLSISTEGEGSVSKDPAQTEYEYGSDVKLTANPASNWSFANWKGDISGSENPKTITVNNDKSITAVFNSNASNDFTLNVGEGGQVTVEEPDGSTVKVDAQNSYNYSAEESVTLYLTAEPLNKKYVFDNYSGGYSNSNKSVEITIDQDMTVDANFAGNVFKMVNSWGSTWGPNNDGTLYITYDAAIQVGLNAWVLGKRDNYQAEALALFDIENGSRGDWTISIKVPNRSSNNIKDFYPDNQVQKGGDHPFPENKMAMDITELMPFEGEDVVLELTNNSGSSGTLESFEIEINGDTYSANSSNITIANNSTKQITIENVSGGTASASLQSSDQLDSSSREITSSDIDSYLQRNEITGINNQIIQGHGTGWNNLTRNQWQAAKEKGTIKIIDSQDILNSSTSLQKDGAGGIEIVDYSESKYFPPIRSQGSEGSCVAWSIGYYIKSYYEAVDHNWDLSSGDNSKIMSPEFVYHLINAGTDNGSYYTDATRVIENIGISSWESMPYSDSNYTSWPSETAFREAADFRSATYNGSTGYYISIQSSDDIEALKNIIADGYLVTVSIDANQYDSLTENGVWTADNYNAPDTNHANTIVGYYE